MASTIPTFPISSPISLPLPLPLPLPPSLLPSSSSPIPIAASQWVGQVLSSVLTFHCDGVCPHSSCLLSILRGFRQGVVYGAKIRFPHALVMTALFRSGSVSSKANDIIQATYTHARSLGYYVALYKLLTCLLRHLTHSSTSPLIPLTSGFIAGGLMFGRSSPITTQINMYVMSRVIFGLLRMLVVRGVMGDWEKGRGYAVYAGVVWALVMVLFEMQPQVLQRSLATSMTYLYHDSDKGPEKGEGLLDWIVREVA